MTDMRTSDDDVFMATAKRMLDETAHQVDPRLAGRLQRARREALEATGPRRWRTWASGVAVASVGVLAMAFLMTNPDVENHTQPFWEDLDLVASTENAELSEDLEFYDWLADSTTAG